MPLLVLIQFRLLGCSRLFLLWKSVSYRHLLDDLQTTTTCWRTSWGSGGGGPILMLGSLIVPYWPLPCLDDQVTNALMGEAVSWVKIEMQSDFLNAVCAGVEVQ